MPPFFRRALRFCESYLKSNLIICSDDFLPRSFFLFFFSFFFFSLFFQAEPERLKKDHGDTSIRVGPLRNHDFRVTVSHCMRLLVIFGPYKHLSTHGCTLRRSLHKTAVPAVLSLNEPAKPFGRISPPTPGSRAPQFIGAPG